jgi:hypothetical protein
VKYQKGWSSDGVHPLLFVAFAIRMTFGALSQAKKRGVVRAGARPSGRQHGPLFLPKGLGLDGQGVADPDFKKKSAEG